MNIIFLFLGIFDRNDDIRDDCVHASSLALAWDARARRSTGRAGGGGLHRICDIFFIMIVMSLMTVSGAWCVFIINSKNEGLVQF